MAVDFLPHFSSVGHSSRHRDKKKQSLRRKMIGNAIISEEGMRIFAPITIERRRQNEIEEIIRLRHGTRIPDPSGTDDYETCISYAEAIAMTPRIQRVDEWCLKWMPWIDAETSSFLARKQASRRYMAKADHVARMLSVTLELRTNLGLRTIGACDISEEDRKSAAAECKREADRQRQRNKRLASGSLKREVYEGNSLAKTKPWIEENISRRTWERRRNEISKLTQVNPAASPSRIDIDISVSYTVATLSKQDLCHQEIPYQMEDHMGRLTEQQREESKERKRIVERDRKRSKRKAAGCTPREEYEANSISRLKPWEEEGISRVTWYRRKKLGPSNEKG